APLHTRPLAIATLFPYTTLFRSHSEQAVHNQIYIAMIVYSLNVLAQLHTKSNRTYLQISRYLKASLWKPAHIWVRKIKGKGVPRSEEHTSELQSRFDLVCRLLLG